MKTLQRGSAQLLFAIAMIVGLVVSTVIERMQAADDASASLSSVDEVIALAKTSEVTQAILKRRLAQTPIPTVSQLRQLRQQVEDQLLLDRAIAVTGKKSLETASIVKARALKHDQDKLAASLKAARESERPRVTNAHGMGLAFYIIALGALYAYVIWKSWRDFRSTEVQTFDPSNGSRHPNNATQPNRFTV